MASGAADLQAVEGYNAFYPDEDTGTTDCPWFNSGTMLQELHQISVICIQLNILKTTGKAWALSSILSHVQKCCVKSASRHCLCPNYPSKTWTKAYWNSLFVQMRMKASLDQSAAAANCYEAHCPLAITYHS